MEVPKLAAEPTAVMALDCEMVRVGDFELGTLRSAVARICMVNNRGEVLMDTFVCPDEPVTRCRFAITGIHRSDLKNAPAFAKVQSLVRSLLEGRILVGHALHYDLAALQLQHPADMLRDTATYPPLMLVNTPGWKAQPRSLRSLALEHLDLIIQADKHTPDEDALATLRLYQLHEKELEIHVSNRTMHLLRPPLKGQAATQGSGLQLTTLQKLECDAVLKCSINKPLCD